MFQHVQVMFNQGMVKEFLAPREILLADFVAVVRKFGRFRSMRFYPDVDRATADLLIATGNATMVEARHGKA